MKIRISAASKLAFAVLQLLSKLCHNNRVGQNKCSVIRILCNCLILYITGQETIVPNLFYWVFPSDSPWWLVHCCSKWAWLNYLAALHDSHWTQRQFNMSQCRDGGVSLSSLCELHVVEPGSVIFLSPRPWFVCVCERVDLGSQEGGLLSGRVAQLSSLCLGQPLGQSGLSGRSSAGATSELACEGGTKERRMIRGQPELLRQDRAESNETGKIPVCTASWSRPEGTEIK